MLRRRGARPNEIGKIPSGLVIDASIARAAGRTDHPISKACRDFLEDVLKICHHVVLTKETSEEWKRHQSKFTLLWRSSMFARKKVERPRVAQGMTRSEPASKTRVFGERVRSGA